MFNSWYAQSVNLINNVWQRLNDKLHWYDSHF